MDECVPRPLRRLLPGHEVATVQEMGWSGKRNGELLQLAADKFDVFMTSDRGILRQQNLTRTQIAIVSLPSNDLESLERVAPKIHQAMDSIERRGKRSVEVTL